MLPPGLRESDKGGGRVPYRVAEREFREHQGGGSFLQPGEGEQVFHQPIQPFGLVPDAVGPLARSIVQLQHVGVG